MCSDKISSKQGVYRRSEDLQLFIDVSDVAELRSHSSGNNELVIGANVNLTEVMDILTKASSTSGFEYCVDLVKHIDLIANVPVRNVSLQRECHPTQFKDNYNDGFFFILEWYDCRKFEYQKSSQRVPFGFIYNFGGMWSNSDYCRECENVVVCYRCRVSQNRYDEKGVAKC